MNIRFLLLLFIPLISFAQNDKISSLAREKINSESASPVNSILLYVERLNDQTILNRGYGWRNSKSELVSPNDRFRIASSTKTFVATIILQLIEEGKMNLNSKASKYLKNVDYLDFNNLHRLNGKSFSNQITIEQLLSHRSGLADIFADKGDDFFSLILQNRQLQYTPKEIVKLYYQFGLNVLPHFEPGNGWSYSDMNYVLLGLIIESMDKGSLAESIRSRILEPLKMENTFFEFYESPTQNHNMAHQYMGDIDMTEINTSFDWAGPCSAQTRYNRAISGQRRSSSARYICE